MPCVSQVGQQAGESGLDHVPVSRSAQRASGKEKKTKGTSGQSGLILSEGTTLSASENLSQSLVSRLRQRLGTVGSMEYVETWKERTTPSGMRYWEHTASGHRTSGSDCTGWAPPTAEDGRRGGLPPRPHDTGVPLSQQVALVGWVSPSSRDWKDTAGMSETGTNPDGSLRVRLDQLPRQAQLAGWSTPRAQDNDQGNHDAIAKAGSSWLGQNRGATVSTQAQLTTGVTSTSSPAEMEKRGVLNPEFVAWLMGYPGEWLSCVDWETLSSRKSPASSSKRTCKPATP